MKKKVICLFVLFILPLCTVFSDTLKEIDEAVNRISAYITTTIQDKENFSISIEPFLSDSKRIRVSGILGQRISSLLQLSLVSVYKHAKITNSLDASSTFTVSGEIQPYEKNVRVIIRIIKSDGSLAGGMYTDIPLTPEINALINANSSLNQGAEQPPPIEDQFEPDDNPGFEVEVHPEGTNTFERNLTFEDVDRFIFQLTDKKSVEISAITNIDIKILLFREGDDFPIATNMDSAGIKSTPINIAIDTGIYVVEISGLTPYVTGPYKLEINFTDRKTNLSEPLSTEGKLTAIKPGERQKRSIPANRPDWIKPQVKIPGFYSLILNSSKAALTLAVYNDKNSQLLFKETGNSPDKPVFAGLFLGIVPIKVGVKPATSIKGPVYYSAVLEKLKVTRVYPDGVLHKLNHGDSPSFILLRIIKSGKYIFTFREPGTDIMVFALPGMVELKGIYDFFLDSGDYLVRIKNRNTSTDNYTSINGE